MAAVFTCCLGLTAYAARMSYVLQNSDLAPKKPAFRVGNFDLYLTRDCAQARAHFGLSQRELELVMHVSGGLTKHEIAAKMGVSPATADTFRRRAYIKLGVHTGSAATAILTAYMAGTRVEESPSERFD